MRGAARSGGDVCGFAAVVAAARFRHGHRSRSCPHRRNARVLLLSDARRASQRACGIGAASTTLIRPCESDRLQSLPPVSCHRCGHGDRRLAAPRPSAHRPRAASRSPSTVSSSVEGAAQKETGWGILGLFLAGFVFRVSKHSHRMIARVLAWTPNMHVIPPVSRALNWRQKSPAVQNYTQGARQGRTRVHFPGNQLQSAPPQQAKGPPQAPWCRSGALAQEPVGTVNTVNKRNPSTDGRRGER